MCLLIGERAYVNKGERERESISGVWHCILPTGKESRTQDIHKIFIQVFFFFWYYINIL